MPDKNDLRLILASGSPRRRELLRDDGYDFNVIVPCDSVEASVPTHLSPEEYVKAASVAKAKAVAATAKEGIVLAADTVAVCDGQIIVVGLPIEKLPELFEKAG
jgi:septum formation protein